MGMVEWMTAILLVRPVLTELAGLARAARSAIRPARRAGVVSRQRSGNEGAR
ncbi:hypothetical protein [Amycolatopsis sp. NPDC004625]|uniref:hypothetical protein n=1 Tax=Amycolatopsis sp. NPDC004625 TaxID=3154670 RepID=UPI0033B51421